METIAISCFLLSIPDFKLYLVHRFRNNCIIHLSTNPIAQFKKPQRSPLRLRFFTCTLESASCVIDMGIFSTMYMIR